MPKVSLVLEDAALEAAESLAAEIRVLTVRNCTRAEVLRRAVALGLPLVSEDERKRQAGRGEGT